jgi:hypothetical protein
MPLVTLKSGSTDKSTPIPTVQRTEAPSVKTITNDTKVLPASQLLTYIEGSPWQVEYYSQLLNNDNPTQGQSVGTGAEFQQYIRYKRFELRVTAPLNQTQDTNTKTMQITGTANLYPGLVPNDGDMFLAETIEGRLAVFEVTNTERKAITKATTYQIEYTLVDYATNERVEDFKKKTQRTYVFVRDLYTRGRAPYIESSKFDEKIEMSRLYEEMVKIYFEQFYNKQFATLTIPGQDWNAYDPFLTKAVLSFFDTTESHLYKHVKLMNVEDDERFHTNTLWDVIGTLEYSRLNYIATQMGLANARSFNNNPMMMPLFYTKLQYIVYPIDPVCSTGIEHNWPAAPLSSNVLQNVPPRKNLPPTTPLPIPGTEYDFFEDLKKDYIDARDKAADGAVVDIYSYDSSLKERYAEVVANYEKAVKLPDYDFYEDMKRGYLSAMDLAIGGPYNEEFNPDSYTDILECIDDEDVIIPDIHLVTKDNYYVLSEGFYQFNNGLQGPGMSRLEVLVCRMIRKMPIDPKDLIPMCRSYHHWGALERYYYVPLLAVLLKYCLNNVV